MINVASNRIALIRFTNLQQTQKAYNYFVGRSVLIADKSFRIVEWLPFGSPQTSEDIIVTFDRNFENVLREGDPITLSQAGSSPVNGFIHIPGDHVLDDQKFFIVNDTVSKTTKEISYANITSFHRPTSSAKIDVTPPEWSSNHIYSLRREIATKSITSSKVPSLIDFKKYKRRIYIK